ncbi:Rhodanese-like domain-containing protein [Entophlyctis helioformis]|nr:Rhodanese-like domain-containing protein [Entophlyctis helioformis]
MLAARRVVGAAVLASTLATSMAIAARPCAGASFTAQRARRLQPTAGVCTLLNRTTVAPLGAASRWLSTAAGARVPPLVSTEWLSQRLAQAADTSDAVEGSGNGRIVVVDATWRNEPEEDPNSEEVWAKAYAQSGWLAWLGGKSAKVADDGKRKMLSDADAYKRMHIQGARFAGIKPFTDPMSSLPNMLPSSREYAQAMSTKRLFFLASDLGITRDDHVVLYDAFGIYSAPRVWWTLKFFGHERVSVLDGGLFKWVRERRAVERGAPVFQATRYPEPTSANMDMAMDMRQMAMHLIDYTNSDSYVIVDARPLGRFAGHDREPRLKVPSGHMPSSINIPHTEFVNLDGTLKQPAAIRAAFEKRNIAIDRRQVVLMSGSSVTAAAVYLALEVVDEAEKAAGRPALPLRRIYDGGWTEWAVNPKSPIRTWANS